MNLYIHSWQPIEPHLSLYFKYLVSYWVHVLLWAVEKETEIYIKCNTPPAVKQFT